MEKGDVLHGDNGDSYYILNFTTEEGFEYESEAEMISTEPNAKHYWVNFKNSQGNKSFGMRLEDVKAQII